MCAGPPLYMSSVNQHKSHVSFQPEYPPYWGSCLLFQWAILGQYNTRYEENQLTLHAHLAIKQKTAKTDVGGATGHWMKKNTDGKK